MNTELLHKLDAVTKPNGMVYYADVIRLLDEVLASQPPKHESHFHEVCFGDIIVPVGPLPHEGD